MRFTRYAGFFNKRAVGLDNGVELEFEIGERFAIKTGADLATVMQLSCVIVHTEQQRADADA